MRVVGCSSSGVAIAVKSTSGLSLTLSVTVIPLRGVEPEEEEGAGTVVGEGTGSATGELIAIPLGVTMASNLRCKYAATRTCPALSAISISGIVSAGPESGTEVT